jgi:hypothetical protein
MLLGNAGIVTVISSLILTFINVTGSGSFTIRIVFLSLGLLLLWMLASSRWVDVYLSRAIDWALMRYTQLELRDYADLLQLSGEYGITELTVKPGGWLAHQTLGETQLREEGILVLGIKRNNNSYIGAPNSTTKLLPHDTLVIYGRDNSIQNLNMRGKNKIGDLNHDQAVKDQEKVIRKEKEKNTTQDGV